MKRIITFMLIAIFTPQFAMTIKPQLELLLGGFPTLNVGIGFGFEF